MGVRELEGPEIGQSYNCERVLQLLLLSQKIDVLYDFETNAATDCLFTGTESGPTRIEILQSSSEIDAAAVEEEINRTLSAAGPSTEYVAHLSRSMELEDGAVQVRVLFSSEKETLLVNYLVQMTNDLAIQANVHQLSGDDNPIHGFWKRIAFLREDFQEICNTVSERNQLSGTSLKAALENPEEIQRKIAEKKSKASKIVVSEQTKPGRKRKLH